MRTHSRILGIAAAVTVFLAATLSAASRPASLALGKWKLNLEKSKFSDGDAPKSQLRTYEDWGDGLVHSVFEGTDSKGERSYTEFVSRFDGRDYPRVSRGSKTASTISLKLVGADGLTSEFVQKEDGKVSLSGRRTLSADRRVMTITYEMAGAPGRPTVMVFDRQ